MAKRKPRVVWIPKHTLDLFEFHAGVTAYKEELPKLKCIRFVESPPRKKARKKR